MVYRFYFPEGEGSFVHRIYFHTTNNSISNRIDVIQRIMLHDITSCEIIFVSKPILYILALLSLICMIILPDYIVQLIIIKKNVIAFGFFIIALILAIAYFVTRQHVLSIKTCSAKIEPLIKRKSLKIAQTIIDKIEAAKDAYRSSNEYDQEKLT